MKKIKKYISLCACCTLPVLAYGQTTNGVDFETADSYKAIGVYDTWENSPFRTGQLQGNVQVVNNHLNEVDEEWVLRPTVRKRFWLFSVRVLAAILLVRVSFEEYIRTDHNDAVCTCVYLHTYFGTCHAGWSGKTP